MRRSKINLLVLLIITVCSIDIRAEVHSCGFEQYLGASNQFLGTCSFDPPLWKVVKHEVVWGNYFIDRFYTSTKNPTTTGRGGCASQDGYVYEECWPIFFAPTHEYRTDYCGDTFIQRVRNQHAGAYDPITLSACYPEASQIWNFDCVSGLNPITFGSHGTCLTSPSTEDDCQAAEMFWNFTDGNCQDTPWYDPW